VNSQTGAFGFRGTPLEYATAASVWYEGPERYKGVAAKRIRRLYPILFRGGANLPRAACLRTGSLILGKAIRWVEPPKYIYKVCKAGSFGAYEKLHIAALAKSFAPKLGGIPPEVARVVVQFAFHCGCY